MTMGRPRKPTVLHVLHGTARTDRHGKNEPKPAPAQKGERRCPASLPPAGKRLWKSLVPELERLHLLTKIDDATLEGACLNYARALQARTIIAKQGLTIVTDKGFVLPHPAVGIERNSWAAWLRFASTFGLTPASRSSINIRPPEHPADRDGDFLFGTGTHGKRGR